MPHGNDNDTWAFEALQHDSDVAIMKWGIESYFANKREMERSRNQRQQFKKDLKYFLSGEYFKDKWINDFINKNS